MATSTNAFFLLKGLGAKAGGAGFVLASSDAEAPETEPTILWGQGTPAGTLAPWTLVNKGSLYMQTNATDDTSHVFMKVDEGGDAADWDALLTSQFAPTLTSSASSSQASFSLTTTLAGTGGTWASAVFGSVTQGASAASVTGYISAAEFETNMAQTSGTPQWYVLSLNANGDETAGLRHANSAYMALWDYGSVKMGNLFYFASLGAVPATASTTAIVSKLSAGKETTCDAAVRFNVAGVQYWLLATTTAPA